MKFIDYLSSCRAFSKEKSNILSWSILALWLSVVIVVAHHHEMWRDEAHCLFLAISADSLWQLPSLVINEGHPILWYLILWLGYQLVPASLILKIISVSIGFISVFLFYRFSPFRIWLKILFLISWLPFYEYTIMARNYGISMLFFFLFATLYSKKKEKPYLLASILFLLANTNIHSAIFVCYLLVFWMYEELSSVSTNDRLLRMKSLWWPFILVSLGVLFAVITVIPDSNSLVMQTSSLHFKDVFNSLVETIKHPGADFEDVFPRLPLLGRDALVWGLAIGLLIRPAAAVVLFIGAITLGLFFAIGYTGALRHQGIFFIFVLSMYWLVSLDTSNRTDLKKKYLFLFNTLLYGLIPVILVVHTVGSYKYIYTDVTQQMSSNKKFGDFIHSKREYADAIVMGEPDMWLESLPYYVDNEIFLPRNNSFQKYVKLDRSNKQILSLGELLEIAQQLKMKEKKPILIALGHFGIAEQEPPLVRYQTYGKKFNWSFNELDAFQKNTRKVAEFKEDIRDEQYEVYELQ